MAEVSEVSVTMLSFKSKKSFGSGQQQKSVNKIVHQYTNFVKDNY